MVLQLGPWTTIGDPMGQGGNSDVYRARRADGTEVALKVLRRWSEPDRLQRFRDEIAVLRALRDEPGVLSLIDAYDPTTPTKLGLRVSCVRQARIGSAQGCLAG